MGFDVTGARKAGYSDAEIAEHLATSSKFDIKGAKGAGYTDGEIINHLKDLTEPVKEETGIAEKALGVGEVALSAITGATTGTIAGALGGANQMGKDIVGLVRDGASYRPAQSVGDAAAQAAAGLTYAPRTETGQEIIGAVGEAAQNLVPMAGLGGQVAAITAGARPAAAQAVRTAAQVKEAAKPVITQATKALQEGADAATQILRDRGIITQPKPTAGTMGSVGAAGTDMAAQRAATAGALPQPIALTKGQASRDFEQQRFEAETAKDPRLGQPLRERTAEQNRQLAANFEAMIDESGAQATNAIETGRTVDKALTQAAAARKNEYRTKYKAAEKAGQMEDPVSTESIVRFLEENSSANAPELAGGTLGIVQRELVRLGGAEMQNGRLVPRELPLRQVELLRRQVGNAMDAAPDNATNMRMGAQIKELIDQQTEGMGGDLYKEARASRRRYAQLFEDNAIVSNLLKTRRGTADRQVALEDVFRKTILNGDRASLSRLRRTLQVAGGEQGGQAWKELQGATLRHLLDEATKGVGTDAAGVPLFSAAKLNNAVRALDADGKLDFVLSKQGAQTVRDLNEIAKVVLTAPPGTINTSNTASVILAALAESGATGAMTGIPLPILTGVKVLSQQVKDAKVRKRVADALNEAKARK